MNVVRGGNGKRVLSMKRSASNPPEILSSLVDPTSRYEYLLDICDRMGMETMCSRNSLNVVSITDCDFNTLYVTLLPSMSLIQRSANCVYGEKREDSISTHPVESRSPDILRILIF